MLGVPSNKMAVFKERAKFAVSRLVLAPGNKNLSITSNRTRASFEKLRRTWLRANE